MIKKSNLFVAEAQHPTTRQTDKDSNKMPMLDKTGFSEELKECPSWKFE